jgi:acetoin utilization deacetylase AcuC-like enzyme
MPAGNVTKIPAMSTLLITHPSFLEHQTGEHHPESPDRLRAVLAALDADDFAGLVRRIAPAATMEQLTRIHPASYVEALLGIRPSPDEIVQIDDSTFISQRSVEAACHAAGAVVAGVEAVLEGEARTAFAAVRPPGHHALPAVPGGFCLLNNVAVGALHAQAKYELNRVAIVDFDVHHGQGTQSIVEADARLFYASSHQYPLYPGTGFARERGIDGNVVNVPLPPGSGSEVFRAAWSQRILPQLERFAPQLLIVSAGFDAHRLDPLAELNVETEDFAWLTEELLDLAGGRLVSALEGGYDLGALADSAAVHVRALMR